MVADGIALVVLNRPQVLNALNGLAIATLRNGLAALRPQAAVRVRLVTGRCRTFYSGADLTDPIMGTETPREERGRTMATEAHTRLNALMHELYAFDEPKIAAVNRLAAGGRGAGARDGGRRRRALHPLHASVLAPAGGACPCIGADFAGRVGAANGRMGVYPALHRRTVD